MPTRLTEIELDAFEFLSLVDAGASGDANHRPAVVLAKRATIGVGKPSTLKIPIVKRDAAQQVVYGLASIVTDDNGVAIVDYDGDVIVAKDLEKAVHAASTLGGVGKAGDMHAHALRGACDIVESAVITREKREAFGGFLGDSKAEGWMVGLKVNDPEVWKSVESGERPELSIKIRAKRTPIENPERQKQMPEVPAATPAAPAAPTAPVADPSAAALDATFDEVLASLTDSQRMVILAKLEAAAKSPPPEGADKDPEEPAVTEEEKRLIEKNQSLEKRVKAMEDSSELRDCIEKARTEMPYLIGMTPEQTGALLKSSKATLPEADYDLLEKNLKAQSTAIAKSELFAEFGSAGDGSGGDVEQEIVSAAKAIVDSDPKISMAKARDMALTNNPDLYKRATGAPKGAH